MLLLICFISFTPQEEEAAAVLRRLRGPRWDVGIEVEQIKESLASARSGGKAVSWRDLLQPEAFKPLIVAFTLLFFFQVKNLLNIL